MISPWITSESFRCPVDVKSKSPSNGVAYRDAFARVSLYIPVVINDPLPGRSVISQPDVYAIGCTIARQFLWPNLVQSPQYFRRHNIFHFPFQPRGVAFPMEWMCVATYLLNVESINACRCWVANKSRMIWRWSVLIGWATVLRQQQGSDQASRYSSASLLAGRRWRAVRGRALVNNSASGVCILCV